MENKQLSIVANGGFVTLTYFEGKNNTPKYEISTKSSELSYPDDFMYACAYLIDVLAKDLAMISPKTPTKKAYEGKTVCVASNHPDIFKVGKIYEWKDGRTVGEDGLLHPTRGKLISLDEITNLALKFLELVE